MKNNNPLKAFLAGILGFGYIYVGKIYLEIFILLAAVFLLFLISWTRWIFNPSLLYLSSCILLFLLLLPIIHPTLIAYRNPQTPRKSYNRWWFYLFWVVGISILGQLLINARSEFFGYETYSIPSASMSPTLQTGDYIMVDTWHYNNTVPKINDLITFELSDTVYIDRVVGVPGDTIEFINGTLYRNGETVNEPFITTNDSGSFFNLRRLDQKVTLQSEQYFVLGDNRANSYDSRQFGSINQSQISGRIKLIWFSTISFDRFPFIFSNDT